MDFITTYVLFLFQLSIKMCDVNNGKVGEQAISLVLPSLLKAGLGSQVQEVREVGYVLNQEW